MICESYCSHGGICALEASHKGLHDSGYCTWSDAESLSKAAADALIAGKPGGSEYLLLEAALGGFEHEEEDCEEEEDYE